MKQLSFIASLFMGIVMASISFGWVRQQASPYLSDSFAYPVSPQIVERKGIINAKALAGTVVDSAGTPIPQVLVEQLSVEGKRSQAVLTDLRGSLLLNSEVEGLYQLRVSKPGFDSQLIRVKVSKGEKKALTVKLTVSH